MYRRALGTVVHGDTCTYQPGSPGQGIVINGVQVTPSNIIHFEHRVDITDGNNYGFIIEHPVAVLATLGIHDAVVDGCRKEWDFYRSTDREAYARGLAPKSVLGLADGSVGSDVAGVAGSIDIKSTSVLLPVVTVIREACFAIAPQNSITIKPRLDGKTALDISVRFLNMGPLEAVYDPCRGLLSPDGGDGIKATVLRARSGAVIGPVDEALYHALGDVVADIAGVGGINKGRVEASLGMGYHKATIGLVKYLDVNGLLVREKEENI